MANLQVGVAGNGTVTVGAGASVHSPASNELTLGTNNAERLRIDSSGRLLKSGQTALTSTSLNHPIQVTADAEAQNICIIGRSADDIGEISFYEADKSTRLGELQYRQDHLNFRHRVGDMRFCTAGTTERLRIDSSGRLLVGTTTNSSPIGWNNNLQVAGTSAVAGVSIRRDENGTGGALLVFGKSRGSLNGSTVVQSGDQIGGMYFAGADGTDVNSIAAQISVEVDGTPGSDDMPGRLIFKTTADGAASPTERLRITSAGAIGIAGANYGSSGQVLTSGGSSAAVSWATPSSSLTSQSVQAEQVTDQTMGTGAWNLVKFNAQNWDTGNNYNHATGEWYYQAPSDGKYWYKASAKLIDLAADKEFNIALYKSTDNGGSYTIQKKSQRWVFTRENTASVVIVETTGLMDLDEDDRIRVYTWHNHGSDRDLDDNFTLFEVFRLGD